MLEENSNGFDVTYITKEYLGDEDGGYSWYSNNTQTFKTYNEALNCFRKRRDSDTPFYEFTIDWNAIHDDVHYGSGNVY